MTDKYVRTSKHLYKIEIDKNSQKKLVETDKITISHPYVTKEGKFIIAITLMMEKGNLTTSRTFSLNENKLEVGDPVTVDGVTYTLEHYEGQDRLVNRIEGKVGDIVDKVGGFELLGKDKEGNANVYSLMKFTFSNPGVTIVRTFTGEAFIEGPRGLRDKNRKIVHGVMFVNEKGDKLLLLNGAMIDAKALRIEGKELVGGAINLLSGKALVIKRTSTMMEYTILGAGAAGQKQKTDGAKPEKEISENIIDVTKEGKYICIEAKQTITIQQGKWVVVNGEYLNNVSTSEGDIISVLAVDEKTRYQIKPGECGAVLDGHIKTYLNSSDIADYNSFFYRRARYTFEFVSDTAARLSEYITDVSWIYTGAVLSWVAAPYAEITGDFDFLDFTLDMYDTGKNRLGISSTYVVQDIAGLWGNRVELWGSGTDWLRNELSVSVKTVVGYGNALFGLGKAFVGYFLMLVLESNAAISEIKGGDPLRDIEARAWVRDMAVNGVNEFLGTNKRAEKITFSDLLPVTMFPAAIVSSILTGGTALLGAGIYSVAGQIASMALEGEWLTPGETISSMIEGAVVMGALRTAVVRIGEALLKKGFTIRRNLSSTWGNKIIKRLVDFGKDPASFTTTALKSAVNFLMISPFFTLAGSFVKPLFRTIFYGEKARYEWPSLGEWIGQAARMMKTGLWLGPVIGIFQMPIQTVKGLISKVSENLGYRLEAMFSKHTVTGFLRGLVTRNPKALADRLAAEMSSGAGASKGILHGASLAEKMNSAIFISSILGLAEESAYTFMTVALGMEGGDNSLARKIAGQFAFYTLFILPSSYKPKLSRLKAQNIEKAIRDEVGTEWSTSKDIRNTLLGSVNRGMELQKILSKEAMSGFKGYERTTVGELLKALFLNNPTDISKIAKSAPEQKASEVLSSLKDTIFANVKIADLGNIRVEARILYAATEIKSMNLKEVVGLASVGKYVEFLSGLSGSELRSAARDYLSSLAKRSEYVDVLIKGEEITRSVRIDGKKVQITISNEFIRDGVRQIADRLIEQGDVKLQRKITKAEDLQFNNVREPGLGGFSRGRIDLTVLKDLAEAKEGAFVNGIKVTSVLKQRAAEAHKSLIEGLGKIGIELKGKTAKVLASELVKQRVELNKKIKGLRRRGEVIGQELIYKYCLLRSIETYLKRSASKNFSIMSDLVSNGLTAPYLYSRGVKLSSVDKVDLETGEIAINLILRNGIRMRLSKYKFTEIDDDAMMGNSRFAKFMKPVLRAACEELYNYKVIKKTLMNLKKKDRKIPLGEIKTEKIQNVLKQISERTLEKIESIKNKSAKKMMNELKSKTNNLTDIRRLNPLNLLNSRYGELLKSMERDFIGKEKILEVKSGKGAAERTSEKGVRMEIFEALRLYKFLENEGGLLRVNKKINIIKTKNLYETSDKKFKDKVGIRQSDRIEEFGERCKIVNKNLELIEAFKARRDMYINKINKIINKKSAAMGRMEAIEEFVTNENNINNLLKDINKGLLGQGQNEMTVTEIRREFLRVFIEQAVILSETFGPNKALHPAQVEMLSAMLRGASVGLAMSSGKTIAALADLVIHRIIQGKKASLEILDASGNVTNYTENPDAIKLLKWFGMEFYNVSEGYKDSKVLEIIDAYDKADVIKVVDPTTRGHLRIMAIANQNQQLLKALDSVTRVIVDEIHKWLLAETSTVMGDGGKPLNRSEIKRMQRLYEALEGAVLVGKKETVVFDNIEFEYKRVQGRDAYEELLVTVNSAKKNVIVEYRATEGGKREFYFSDSALKVLASAKGEYLPHQIASLLRGMVTEVTAGGLRLANVKGKYHVKPMSGEGKAQLNMILRDVNLQLGFAFKTGSWKDAIRPKGINSAKGDNLTDNVGKWVEVSETTLQTSLTAIYGNTHAKMSGMSGTVLGLQQLMLNRIGSETYDISSERLDPKSFTVMEKDVTVKSLIEKMGEYDNLLLAAKEEVSLLELRKIVIDLAREGKLSEYSIYEFANRETPMSYNRDKNDWESFKGDINKLAKDFGTKEKPTKRIFLVNEQGMTGVDYQGKFRLIVKDAHLMPESDLAQLLKRVGRTSEDDTWDSDRILVIDEASAKSMVEQFVSTPKLVRCVERLWKGEVGGRDGFLADSKALELLKETYKLIKNNGKYKDKALNQDQQRDLMHLSSKICELYKINSSTRFIIRDVLQDAMVLKPLRELLELRVLKGRDRKIVEEEMSRILNEDPSGADINLLKHSTENAEAIFRQILKNSSKEAVEVFTRLSRQLSRGAVKKFAKAHLKEIKSIRSIKFKDIDISYNGTFIGARSIMELIATTKSLSAFILPMSKPGGSRSGGVSVDMRLQIAESTYNIKNLRETGKKKDPIKDEHLLREAVTTRYGEDLIRAIPEFTSIALVDASAEFSGLLGAIQVACNNKQQSADYQVMTNVLDIIVNSKLNKEDKQKLLSAVLPGLSLNYAEDYLDVIPEVEGALKVANPIIESMNDFYDIISFAMEYYLPSQLNVVFKKSATDKDFNAFKDRLVPPLMAIDNDAHKEHIRFMESGSLLFSLLLKENIEPVWPIMLALKSFENATSYMRKQNELLDEWDFADTRFDKTWLKMKMWYYEKREKRAVKSKALQTESLIPAIESVTEKLPEGDNKYKVQKRLCRILTDASFDTHRLAAKLGAQSDEELNDSLAVLQNILPSIYRQISPEKMAELISRNSIGKEVITPEVKELVTQQLKRKKIDEFNRKMQAIDQEDISDVKKFQKRLLMHVRWPIANPDYTNDEAYKGSLTAVQTAIASTPLLYLIWSSAVIAGGFGTVVVAAGTAAVIGLLQLAKKIHIPETRKDFVKAVGSATGYHHGLGDSSLAGIENRLFDQVLKAVGEGDIDMKNARRLLRIATNEAENLKTVKQEILSDEIRDAKEKINKDYVEDFNKIRMEYQAANDEEERKKIDKQYIAKEHDKQIDIQEGVAKIINDHVPGFGAIIKPGKSLTTENRKELPSSKPSLISALVNADNPLTKSIVSFIRQWAKATGRTLNDNDIAAILALDLMLEVKSNVDENDINAILRRISGTTEVSDDMRTALDEYANIASPVLFFTPQIEDSGKTGVYSNMQVKKTSDDGMSAVLNDATNYFKEAYDELMASKDMDPNIKKLFRQAMQEGSPGGVAMRIGARLIGGSLAEKQRGTPVILVDSRGRVVKTIIFSEGLVSFITEVSKLENAQKKTLSRRAIGWLMLQQVIHEVSHRDEYIYTKKATLPEEVADEIKNKMLDFELEKLLFADFELKQEVDRILEEYASFMPGKVKSHHGYRKSTFTTVDKSGKRVLKSVDQVTEDVCAQTLEQLMEDDALSEEDTEYIEALNVLAKDKGLPVKTKALYTSEANSLRYKPKKFHAKLKKYIAGILNVPITTGSDQPVSSSETDASKNQIKDKHQLQESQKSVYPGFIKGIVEQLQAVEQISQPYKTFEGLTIAHTASTIWAKEGINIYIVKLVGMLASRNANLTQIVFYEHPNPTESEEATIDIGSSKIIFKPYMMNDSEDLGDRLEANNSTDKPIDLIITHVPFFDEAKRASEFAAENSIPFASYAHFGVRDFSDEQRRILGDTLTRNPGTVVLGVSEGSVKEIQRNGIKAPVEKVGPIVTIDRFSPIEEAEKVQVSMARHLLGASEDDVLLLVPATFLPNKNPMDLIRAANDLINNRGIKNIKIAFIGQANFSNINSLLEEAQSYIQENNLEEHIVIKDAVDQSLLRLYYAASDMIVLPSRSEGLPLVLTEAALMEKPVVVYNLPGMDEAVANGKTGLLVEWDEDDNIRIDNLANAIKGLCEDPKAREAMGAAGPRYVHEQFDPNKLIVKHEDIYAKAMGIAHRTSSAGMSEESKRLLNKALSGIEGRYPEYAGNIRKVLEGYDVEIVATVTRNDEFGAINKDGKIELSVTFIQAISILNDRGVMILKSVIAGLQAKVEGKGELSAQANTLGNITIAKTETIYQNLKQLMNSADMLNNSKDITDAQRKELTEGILGNVLRYEEHERKVEEEGKDTKEKGTFEGMRKDLLNTVNNAVGLPMNIAEKIIINPIFAIMSQVIKPRMPELEGTGPVTYDADNANSIVETTSYVIANRPRGFRRNEHGTIAIRLTPSVISKTENLAQVMGWTYDSLTADAKDNVVFTVEGDTKMGDAVDMLRNNGITVTSDISGMNIVREVIVYDGIKPLLRPITSSVRYVQVELPENSMAAQVVAAIFAENFANFVRTHDINMLARKLSMSKQDLQELFVNAESASTIYIKPVDKKIQEDIARIVAQNA
ncbi:MAG: glycosyltransferase family 4 protein [Candidatus Orphnella occulta]|nr:glycosyltransferase family 4 protein [Candidatus Orphnella occulta]